MRTAVVKITYYESRERKTVESFIDAGSGEIEIIYDGQDYGTLTLRGEEIAITLDHVQKFSISYMDK
jgi:hypothetical protein